MNVLFSPHSDDECLFACWTLIREKPRVVVCFPSSGDYGPTHVRLGETNAALDRLGVNPATQWDGTDLVQKMRALDATDKPATVWAPDVESSHSQHVAVSAAAREVFGDRLRTYHTYWDGEKVTDGREVPFEPEWLRLKLEALACYRSQIAHPRAHVFFTADLREWAPA